MLSIPYHKVAYYRESHSLLFNETICGKHWEADVELFGLALQSNSSDCSANTTQTIGTLFAQYYTELWPNSPTYLQDIIQVNVWNLQTIWLLTNAQASMLHRILTLICSSDICWKIVSSWVKTLPKSPTCRMDTWETAASKDADAAAPWRVSGDICALAILKKFFNHEEIILAYTGMCSLLLPKNKGHTISIQLLP